MVELASMREGHHAEKTHGVSNQQKNHNVSMLDQIDLALASRLVGEPVEQDLIAGAQRALDGIRRPAPTDAEFLISLLRLRGFSVDLCDLPTGLQHAPCYRASQVACRAF